MATEEQQQQQFAELDKLYDEGKYSEVREQLTKEGRMDPTSADVLWRLARVFYQMAAPLDPKNPKKKELLDEGHKHAIAAHQIKPTEYNVLKWLAALTGARTDYLGTKEKIEQGNAFKALLDECLAMQPDDYALLFMRGRFAYSVSSLSWFERKAASTFFATLSEANWDDAVRDFLAVYQLKPLWVENLVYLAKSYIAKGDKSSAVEYLKQAAQIEDKDERGEDTEASKEAKELFAKHGK